MTDDMMNLRRLVEKTPDCRSIAEMIGFAGQWADGDRGRCVDRAAYQGERLERSALGDPPGASHLRVLSVLLFGASEL